MIIRAVSDDDDSDDNARHDTPLRDGSVFGADPPLLPALSSVHAAKLAWIGTTLALIALLLVDVAAVMSHVQRFGSSDSASADAAASSRDPFALLALLLDAWTTSDSAVASVLSAAGSATALNNAVGVAGAAAWMYVRESNVQDARTRRSTRSSRSIMQLRSPWTLVAGVVCIGHVVTCAYVLLALLESNGERHQFFLGRSRASRTHPRV